MQEGELVEENAPADCEDEVAELRHDAGKVRHQQDLGRDDAGNTNRRNPHDNADHPDRLEGEVSGVAIRVRG